MSSVNNRAGCMVRIEMDAELMARAVDLSCSSASFPEDRGTLRDTLQEIVTLRWSTSRPRCQSKVRPGRVRT